MRSFLQIAGTVLVAGSLLFMNWHPLAAQAIGSNADCAYCGDYTDNAPAAGKVRTDWRVGLGYVDEDVRRVSATDNNADATVFEISCAYCGDYADKAPAAGEIRTDWRVGVGYAAERTDRVAAK